MTDKEKLAEAELAAFTFAYGRPKILELKEKEIFKYIGQSVMRLDLKDDKKDLITITNIEISSDNTLSLRYITDKNKSVTEDGFNLLGIKGSDDVREVVIVPLSYYQRTVEQINQQTLYSVIWKNKDSYTSFNTGDTFCGDVYLLIKMNNVEDGYNFIPVPIYEVKSINDNGDLSVKSPEISMTFKNWNSPKEQPLIFIDCGTESNPTGIEIDLSSKCSYKFIKLSQLNINER